jgi:hypothetical protein
MVRKRAREQLALGASQLKLMAGGGVSSAYDPLDVTQYTAEEMRAVVEAAENWGTYITVHAYTNKAVNQAIEAGVKCIDHGQLLEDEEPFKTMAKKGVWLSLQAFFNDGDRKSPYPEGSDTYKKQMLLYAGTKRAYRWPSSTGSSWPGALTCCTTPPMRRSRGGCAPSRNESFDTFLGHLSGGPLLRRWSQCLLGSTPPTRLQEPADPTQGVAVSYELLCREVRMLGEVEGRERLRDGLVRLLALVRMVLIA